MENKKFLYPKNARLWRLYKNTYSSRPYTIYTVNASKITNWKRCERSEVCENAKACATSLMMPILSGLSECIAGGSYYFVNEKELVDMVSKDQIRNVAIDRARRGGWTRRRLYHIPKVWKDYVKTI